MSAFKTFTTLVLVLIIGLALVLGPIGVDQGKGAPGPQSPPDPNLSLSGPSALVIMLALGGAVLLGMLTRLRYN